MTFLGSKGSVWGIALCVSVLMQPGNGAVLTIAGVGVAMQQTSRCAMMQLGLCEALAEQDVCQMLLMAVAHTAMI
jgi:hypothetical protein